MIYIGIDPGAKGSMCIDNGSLTFIDYSTNGLKSYIEALKAIKEPCIACIEKVHSMPGQGVSSTFSFGQRLGELEGMLQALEIPYTLVSPRIWQKSCAIPSKSDKKTIANILIKLYPKAELYGKKGGLLDGRSDSLGLMHYAKIFTRKDI